jgi:hypothetical protein
VGAGARPAACPQQRARRLYSAGDHARDALLALLQPWLDALALELAGCRKLQVEMRFLDGSTHTLRVPFVTAVIHEPALRATLRYHLQSLRWPAEVERLTVAALETGELPAEQLALLPEYVEAVMPGAALVQRLRQVYGPVFYRGALADPRHPVASRRAVGPRARRSR